MVAVELTSGKFWAASSMSSGSRYLSTPLWGPAVAPIPLWTAITLIPSSAAFSKTGYAYFASLQSHPVVVPCGSIG